MGQEEQALQPPAPAAAPAPHPFLALAKKMKAEEEAQKQAQKQEANNTGKPPIPQTSSGASNGAPKAPSAVPAIHNRNVSWGVKDVNVPASEIKAGNAADDNLSQVTHPDGASRVSLREIVQQSPLETEAETYIIKSLDTADQTKSGHTEAEQSILGGVPPDIAHNFSADTEGGTSKAKKAQSPRKGHRTQKSTAENLWEVTADLMKMQQSGNKSGSFGSFSDGRGSADVLANNAALLLRRHKASQSSNTEPEQNVGPAPTAASRWAKLRTTVQVAGPAGVAQPMKVDNDVANMEAGNNTKIDEGGDDTSDSSHSDGYDNGKHRRKQSKVRSAVKSGFHDFEDWVKFKKANIYTHVKLMMFVIIPATCVAAILFYLVDNPPCGTYEECGTLVNRTVATNVTVATNATMGNTTTIPGRRVSRFLGNDEVTSYSWWIIFVCVRHVLMFTLAAATQAFVIDFMCIRTRIMLAITGPMVTLYTVQSKGWPFQLTFWSLYAFAFLYGEYPLANHWLYWQDAIDMFNEQNPSGGVTSLESYRQILILAVVVGVSVSIKRFWVGLFLGRQTFSRYAADLATLMRKALLIGQVATLGKDIHHYQYRLSDFDMDHDMFTSHIRKEEEVGDNSSAQGISTQASIKTEDFKIGEERVFDSRMRKNMSGSSARIKIDKLLGAWEEPKEVNGADDKVHISSIIQFRNSLSCLNTHVPFSAAFGLASTREECIESSETLFRRLLEATPGKYLLTVDVIALCAIHDDGELDEEKLRELIRLFRPDRDGNLTLIDFAKSVDAVYKELRLLRASVSNSSRMDRAFEGIINIFFYFVLACICLAVVGIDPLVLFASISGFVLGFAFMIGAACSKMFEGILLILVRRPYDIGDRIAISNPNSDTSPTGSTTWFVRDVTLFTTTVCLAASNEVATYSNGSLAGSRIINAARSPQAAVWFCMKFPISASYDTLKVFKGAIEEFVKARPREYISFGGFRATRVEADQGFVEYIVIVVHRESWQNIGAILTSKAELQSFCLELSKKMNLRYTSPPMPIDLRMNQTSMNALGLGSGTPGDYPMGAESRGLFEDGSSMPGQADIEAVRAMFDPK